MPRAKGTIDIVAPANLVWKWIIEPEKYLVWNIDFKEYKIIDEKKEKVGTTYYVVAEKGGALRKLDCVITEWVENKKLVFKAISEEIEAEGCYTIEPTEGGYRVTFEENLELKGAVAEIVDPPFSQEGKAREYRRRSQEFEEEFRDKKIVKVSLWKFGVLVD